MIEVGCLSDPGLEKRLEMLYQPVNPVVIGDKINIEHGRPSGRTIITRNTLKSQYLLKKILPTIQLSGNAAESGAGP
jgi:hypothetical protein